MSDTAYSKTLLLIVGSIIFCFLSSCNFDSSSWNPKIGNASSSRTSSVESGITQYEWIIQDNPENIWAYITMSSLYQQKIRETADISYYDTIDSLMDKAEVLSPQDPDILSQRAQVALGRHSFQKWKQYILKALAINPSRATYYWTLGDAEIELGEYTGAIDAFQKMIDIRPDYSSYIRIAYLREIYGDIQGAKDSIGLAIDAGSTNKENIAFAYTELWKLDMRSDLSIAQAQFESALKIVENYPPALEWLGKIAYFQGNATWAIAYFETAYEKLPLVQYLVDTADIYTLIWQSQKALLNLTLAKISFELSLNSGVNNSLESSLFLTDHDLDLSWALEKVKKSYEERPNIFVADALSWALYKNQKLSEANSYTKEALRIWENDSVILYHQGMIALANGNRITAKKYLSKALSLHPYFSLLDSKKAKDALVALQ